MVKNPYLSSAFIMLKKMGIYPKFVDENIVELSIDKNTKVFAFLIVEKEQFPGIIFNIALDCFESHVTADIAINLMHIVPVALGEPFYRSANGMLYWGEDSYKYFTLEYDNNLLKEALPINDNLH